MIPKMVLLFWKLNFKNEYGSTVSASGSTEWTPDHPETDFCENGLTVEGWSKIKTHTVSITINGIEYERVPSLTGMTLLY